MPMSVEGVVAMQACARIGAPTRWCSAASRPRACSERIIDAGAVAVITADEQMRGGKAMPLKPIVDEAFAMGGCEASRTSSSTSAPAAVAWPPAATLDARRDPARPTTCEPEWVGAEHPLFILYTSGSTGKPKGVQHSTGGYLLHAALTMKWTFDIKPTTSSGARPTSAGSPATPTSPTARSPRRHRDRLRGRAHLPGRGPLLEDDPGPQGQHLLHRAHRDPLADQGREPTTARIPNYDLSSLRILGSVGEPINPEAWMWYHTTSAAAAARSSTPSGRPRPAAT
jgi:acetyl-CoA synthetase